MGTGGFPESIKSLLERGIKYLDQAARLSAEYSERHFKFLGVLTIVIPLAYIVDYYVGRPYFDTFAIRTLAFCAAIPLIASSKRTANNFHIYFVAAAAYVLPFTFGLMLVLNAASAPPGSEIEILWVLQYFISLFLFIQLIHNGVLATVLWVLSSLAALSPLLILDEVNWQELKRVMLYPITGYLTALFFGIITNRNVDYVNSEKLRAASAIGSNIAHELRTPLASIRSLARSVRNHSETLADAYVAAQDAGLETKPLTPQQIEGLKSALSAIEREVEYSNTTIDILLINTTKSSLARTQTERLPISEVVDEAITRYPFNNSYERRLITTIIQSDFVVNCSRQLLIHVFFNLLKNSIYYAQRSKTGHVTIKIHADRCLQWVDVTDTGPGLSSSSLKRVFDRFYTTTDSGQGAGIGLSFCKMVMESIGGEIQCESKEGEFTTFRLIFPDAPEEEPPKPDL